MSSFKERRESILGVFTQAKIDLENLNSDIQDEIEANQSQIKNLTSQNEELNALKTSNNSVIKIFTKIFK